MLLHEQERDALIAATASQVLLTPGSTFWGIGNALIAGWRRRRLTLDDVVAAWNSYEEIPLRVVEVNAPRALHTAAEYGLYAYDAYVLGAALERHVPLLALDQGLCCAAKRAGAEIVEF